MNCNDYRQIASARLDGHCTPDEARLLDAHLAGCDGCRKAESAMRAVGSAVSPGPVAVPPGFRSALFERLESEALLPPKKGRLIAFPFWRWAAVPLAAAAGLAFFLLVGRDAVEIRPDGRAAAPQLARQAAPAVSPSDAGPSPRPAESAPAAGETGGVASAPSPGSGPALSPEDAEIVAHLDLLENPEFLDEPPAGLDDLLMPAPKGRG
jgi:hypothetical protein